MSKKLTYDKIKNFIKNPNVNDGDIIERKQLTFTPQMMNIEGEERTIDAIVSTKGVDRDGDIVWTDGIALDEFIKLPLIYWQHRYSDMPIGMATEVSKAPDSIHMRMKIGNHAMAQDVWQWLKDGFPLACSIGFVAKGALLKGTKQYNQFRQDNKIMDEPERIITSSTLLENSIVGLPSNKETQIYAISKSFSPKFIKEMGFEYEEVPCEDMMEDKPFANEHSFRQTDPSKYNRFRRVNDELGDGIDVIYGITEDGKAEIQTIRIDASKYTYEEAKKKIEELGFNTSNAEPASEGKTIEEPKEPKTEPKVEPKAEEPKAEEPKVEEAKVEEPKVEEPKVEPKVEEVKPEPKWVVIRDGDYQLTEEDKQIAKAIKMGRIL